MKIRIKTGGRHIPNVGTPKSGEVVNIDKALAIDLISQGIAEETITPKKYRKKVGEKE